MGWRGCRQCNYDLSYLARDFLYHVVSGYSLNRCDCFRIGIYGTGTENQASPITGIADIVGLGINLESRDNLYRLIRYKLVRNDYFNFIYHHTSTITGKVTVNAIKKLATLDNFIPSL